MATLYPITGGGNWSGSIWKTSPGQAASNHVAPLATDDVIFDPLAVGTVTVDGAGTTCKAKTLTCQSANNKITLTAAKVLNIYGSVAFFSGMTLSGTGQLNLRGGGNMTQGVASFPGELLINIAGTYVLKDNWVVTGLTTFGSNAIVLNHTAAETLTCNGGLYVAISTSGSAQIIVGGGNLYGYTATAILENDLQIAPNAADVILTATLYYKTGTLSYSAGAHAFNSNSKTLNISGTCTLNTTGLSWYNVTIGATLTLALSSTLTISNALTFGAYTVSITGTGNIDAATVSFSYGSAVITTDADLSCTKIRVSTGSNLIFAGAFNLECDILYCNSNGYATAIYLVNGQTLTVNTDLDLLGCEDFTLTIQSDSPGDASCLDYLGDVDDCRVMGVDFVDIDASGSAQAIDDWYGTVDGCANINARTSADIGGGSAVADVFGWVA